ncbi:MAG: hypothetical protein RL653_1945 [Pseudomonadota bacterium]|jgi:hypothetical protein
MRDDDWLDRLRRLVARRHDLTSTELEVAGIGRQQLSFAQVLFRVLRRVDRGLYVDAGLTMDLRWVALPHGWRPPRTGLSGLAFQHLRVGWDASELECFHPPGLPGLELRRFTPVRTFAELLAAGRFGTAEEVGRALLARGVPSEALGAALSVRGVRRETVRRTLQLIRTPRA